jgi:hypothetical protein
MPSAADLEGLDMYTVFRDAVRKIVLGGKDIPENWGELEVEVVLMLFFAPPEHVSDLVEIERTSKGLDVYTLVWNKNVKIGDKDWVHNLNVLLALHLRRMFADVGTGVMIDILVKVQKWLQRKESAESLVMFQAAMEKHLLKGTHRASFWSDAKDAEVACFINQVWASRGAVTVTANDVENARRKLRKLLS